MGLWSWATEWRGYRDNLILLCIRTTACPLQWTATLKQDLEWLLPGTREGGLQRLECQQYLSPTAGGRGRGKFRGSLHAVPFLPSHSSRMPNKGVQLWDGVWSPPQGWVGQLHGAASAGWQKRGGKTPNPHLSPNHMSIFTRVRSSRRSFGEATEGGVAFCHFTRVPGLLQGRILCSFP